MFTDCYTALGREVVSRLEMVVRGLTTDVVVGILAKRETFDKLVERINNLQLDRKSS